MFILPPLFLVLNHSLSFFFICLIQGKIKQHSMFQQEVGANKDAIKALEDQSQAMCSANHHRKDDLDASRHQLSEVTTT